MYVNEKQVISYLAMGYNNDIDIPLSDIIIIPN